MELLFDSAPSEPVLEPAISQPQPVATEEFAPTLIQSLFERLEVPFNPEELPKGDHETAVEYLAELFKENAIGHDEVRKINDFVRKGGTIEEYLDLYERSTNKIDYASLDYNDTETLIALLEQKYELEGRPEDEIVGLIEYYMERGLLRDKAIDAAEQLYDLQERQLKEEEERRLAERQRESEIADRYRRGLHEVIMKGDTNDFVEDLTRQEREYFVNYFLKPDASGYTPYERDLQRDPYLMQKAIINHMKMRGQEINVVASAKQTIKKLEQFLKK